jgi:hypothetical protein
MISARLNHCPHCTYIHAGLSNVFRDRIMSNSIWPACSPYLNYFEYLFIWGCLKDNIYNSKPQLEAELKENILREIVNMHAEYLQLVYQDIFR